MQSLDYQVLLTSHSCSKLVVHYLQDTIDFWSLVLAKYVKKCLHLPTKFSHQLILVTTWPASFSDPTGGHLHPASIHCMLDSSFEHLILSKGTPAINHAVVSEVNHLGYSNKNKSLPNHLAIQLLTNFCYIHWLHLNICLNTHTFDHQNGA